MQTPSMYAHNGFLHMCAHGRQLGTQTSRRTTTHASRWHGPCVWHKQEHGHNAQECGKAGHLHDPAFNTRDERQKRHKTFLLCASSMWNGMGIAPHHMPRKSLKGFFRGTASEEHSKVANHRHRDLPTLTLTLAYLNPSKEPTLTQP